MTNFVIIGTGPAGVAAAQAIRSQDGRASIQMVGDEAFGYYSRPGLAYYLTGEIPEKGLFPYTPGELKQLDLRRLAGAVYSAETDHVLYAPYYFLMIV